MIEVMINIAYREKIRIFLFPTEGTWGNAYLCTKNIRCGRIACQLIEPQDELSERSGKHGSREEITPKEKC